MFDSKGLSFYRHRNEAFWANKYGGKQRPGLDRSAMFAQYRSGCRAKGEKMRKVKVVTDTTTGLPKEMIEKFGIDVVPARVILGAKGYPDDGSVSTKELFEFAASTGTLPYTMPPNDMQFQEIFQKWMEEDYDIFFTGLSGKIAPIVHIAESVLPRLVPGRVSIVDSLNVSSGTGLQVLEAAEMAQRGAGLLEVTKHVYSIRPRVRNCIVLDTLKYLYLGGRCSKLASVMGDTMGVKPVVEVKDGVMMPVDKLRGKRYMDKFIELVMQDKERIDPKRVFVTDCLCDEVGEVKERLVNEFGFKNVIVTDAPPTTAVHVGPGSLGIMYLYK